MSYYDLGMSALSVKLPHDLYASLSSEARRRNVTRSALVREILADALARDAEGQPPNCAELAGDLVGAFRSGRSDLATNKELLREAMLADAAGRHR